MDLNEALRRVGALVLNKPSEQPEAAVTVYLRVDPEQGAKWSDCVQSFLLGAIGRPYKVDVSKYFYADQGAVKYRWRIVVRGEDAKEALVLLAQCAVEAAAAHAPQFDSFPFVGQVRYPRDPATGKLKGGHDLDEAPRTLALALGGTSMGGS